jgi:hypothetical protein
MQVVVSSICLTYSFSSMRKKNRSSRALFELGRINLANVAVRIPRSQSCEASGGKLTNNNFMI